VPAADIVKALRPKTKVRGLSLDQSARESRQSDAVNRLQREKTRALTVDEQDEIAAVVEDRAGAVRDFLIEKFTIAPELLVAIGIGGEDASAEAETRRVRVVNVRSEQAAKSSE
jgi:hypothetical protein